MSPQRILHVVAAECGVTVDDLTTPFLPHRRKGTREKCYARHLAARLLHELIPGASTASIGRVLGRDHTTIIHSLRMGKRLHHSNQEWRKRYDQAVVRLYRGTWAQEFTFAVREAKR